MTREEAKKILNDDHQRVLMVHLGPDYQDHPLFEETVSKIVDQNRSPIQAVWDLGDLAPEYRKR